MQNIYGNGELIKCKLEPTRYIDTQLVISLQGQKRITDMLYQKYIPSLDTGAAKDVMMFILARTFVYNKVKEIISINQISKGVYTKRKDGTNDMVTRGTGLSRSTIFKALRLLENRGYITREENRYSHTGSQLANIYGINIKFFNDEIIKNNKESNMRHKKKKTTTPEERIAANEKLMEAIPDDFKPQVKLTEGNENDLNEGSQGVSSIGRGGLVDDYPITTSINILEIDNHSKENISNSTNCRDVKGFKKYYELKFKEYFPGRFIPFSQKQHGQVKSLFSKVTQIEDLKIAQFLDYCFSNWDYIVKNKLGFLETHSKSDLPDSADINILLKFTNKFLEGYMETEEDFTPKFGDPIEFRIKELMKQGSSFAVASKRAVYEHESRQARKEGLESKIDQIESTAEIEKMEIAMKYKNHLESLQRENDKLKQELAKEKNKDILKFSLNNVSIEDLD